MITIKRTPLLGLLGLCSIVAIGGAFACSSTDVTNNGGTDGGKTGDGGGGGGDGGGGGNDGGGGIDGGGETDGGGSDTGPTSTKGGSISLSQTRGTAVTSVISASFFDNVSSKCSIL